MVLVNCGVVNLYSYYSNNNKMNNTNNTFSMMSKPCFNFCIPSSNKEHGTEQSFAYLGPGLAFGMLAAIISFFGAILILIYGFFFKIFKIFKNRRSKKKIGKIGI